MGTNKYVGTKTEKNLWEAFAGESQVRNKYTYCCLQNSPDKGGVLVRRYLSGMVSTHLLASWEFHCFSTASAAFHKVLRSAYSGGAFAGSRISLWTIPRFFRVVLHFLVVFTEQLFAALVSSGGNSRLPLAALHNRNFVVWTGHFVSLLPVID